MKKSVLLIPIIVALVAVLALLGIGSNLVRSQSPIEARVIAWEFTPSDDGQVEALTSAGESEVLVDFPAGQFANEARVCGHDAWSPDGKGVAIYTGAAEGSIAIFPAGGGAPVALGTANRMACSGPATFQFAPNGKRVGYINYADDTVNRDFPYGNLVIFDAAAGSQLAAFDWATAFALYDDGALMLRFYPDGKGNATEADVDWWDGSAQQNLVTLEPVYPADKPDVECGMTSGSLVKVGDSAYILTGQKCETGTVNWRLVSVPMKGGAVTEIASGAPGGGFFSESFTTQLIPTTDGKGFLVTVPSGLARNTVRLQWVTSEGTITPILEGSHIIVDRFGERLSEGRHMMASMDGKSIAFVSSSADQEQSLWLLDLSTPGGAPVAAEELGANERIFQYVWASNTTLYYAAGSIESSTLKSIAPGESAQRLARGRFFRLAVNYKGDKIAAAEWFANPESVGDDLFKLTLLDTSGQSAALKEGDKEHNQMIPLAIQ
jgi:hypothetical protein